MGLLLPGLRFLVREHKRKAFTDPLLTLGRQCVYATYDSVLAMLKAEGIEPKPLPGGLSLATNIPAWQGTPYSKYTSDKVFFRALAGCDALALDVSEYEGADYIWDLNNPIPPELESQFGVILDAGTLEHVFDVKQALQNLNRMLVSGGRVIHMSPGSNFLEHGFYQFSPTLFYDYYGVNGFTELRCFILEIPHWTYTNGKNQVWEWDLQRPYCNLMSHGMLLVIFCAEKTLSSTVDRIPQQGDSLRHADGGRTGSSYRSSKLHELFFHLPPRIKLFIVRLLKRDLSAKPWGLKYLGRF
jgi:SAM-dependent methyltransferase